MRRSGKGWPSPWPTHHPHLWKAGSPNPLRVGGWVGWRRLGHISWHASRLGKELAQGTYRTQALAYCPHQSLGKQVCAWMTPISEYSIGSFLPAARSNGPGTQRLRLRLCFQLVGFMPSLVCLQSLDPLNT